MAHFAEIDSTNIVVRVIVVADEHELNGAEWCNNLFGGNWVQTSYNNNIRKQYAGVGYTYDAVNDVFILPQPYGSWTLDENFDWQPPTSMPSDASETKGYAWSEPDQQWIELVES